MNEVTVSVLGGLPVTVKYFIEKADREVGIMSDSVGDWWIVAIAGKPRKNTEWVTKRLSDSDEEKINVACWSDYVA